MLLVFFLKFCLFFFRDRKGEIKSFKKMGGRVQGRIWELFGGRKKKIKIYCMKKFSDKNFKKTAVIK